MSLVPAIANSARRDGAHAYNVEAAVKIGHTGEHRTRLAQGLLTDDARPKDALALYQAAANSPIPHLDWDQIIQSGIKETKNALSGGNPAVASAQ